jgi:porin
MNEREDYIAIGASWGRPPADVTSGRTNDQLTLETYYRAQIFPHISLTPNFQLLVNPALNPTASSIWLLGLRLRAAF